MSFLVASQWVQYILVPRYQYHGTFYPSLLDSLQLHHRDRLRSPGRCHVEHRDAEIMQRNVVFIEVVS